MKYQLVIQFPLADTSADDFDRLLMIENELGLALRGKHQVEGHDMGPDEMNIFIHTNDPDGAFKLVKNILSENDLGKILAACRDIKSDEYSVLWPEDSNVEFSI